MKKIIIAVLLLAASLQLGAIPAKPGAFIWTQPDGSKLTLYRHGDEFEHWTADANGNEYILVDGWYILRSSGHKPSIRASRNREQANRMRAERRSNPVTHGTHRIPVILVEFSDVKFSVTEPATAFSALLNQAGYSANGATGSVRDYYLENSNGEYLPEFEVIGPVTLSNNMKYYGENSNDEECSDLRPELALYDALVLLDGQYDFSVFDPDGDGNVDMTLFYYAGYNEAERGPEDSIWPHQWSLNYSSSFDARRNSFDGVHFGQYFCTSELRGSSGKNMCGIGTTCHEFAHSLGLPDFYDTDYEKNGECGALYWFSMMSSGAYNNDGRTPPYLGAEELVMLDWMDESDMEEIKSDGQYTLLPVEQKKAYKITGAVEGEYFILETRDGQGWDSPLPSGMIVYHADKSKTRSISISGSSYSPYELWSYTNQINANGKHPCFYIIPAANQKSLNYSGYLSDFPFPGRYNVTSYQPVDWNGNNSAVNLSSISYASGKTTFTVMIVNEKGIKGTVTDTSGNPIQGATIHVTPVEESSPVISRGASRLSSIKPKSAGAPIVTETNAQGYFEVDLKNCNSEKVEVCAYMDNYVPTSDIVTLSPQGNTITITMLRVGESLPSDLGKWNENGEALSLGLGNTSYNLMFATMFSESELAGYRGDLIKSVTILPNISSGNLYIIIDFGSTRALTYKVPNPVYGQEITVSLESFDLHIPQSGEVYFGYGLENYDNDYPFVCYSPASYGCYYDILNMSSSDWGSLSDYDLYLSVNVLKEGVDPGTTEHSIAEMGFSMIEIPENVSMTAGTELPLNVLLGEGVNPASISWSMDGTSLSGSSVTLTSGTHILRATLYFNDGSDETIEVELEVL